MAPDPGEPISVGEAIRLCNARFADQQLSVEGEVSGFSLSRGRFVFFDLKDEQEEACLHCFMMAFQLSMPVEDGMRVVAQARPGIHPKSGHFRLTVQRLEARGEGSLRRAFELLKAKLEAEGLFARERKRLLPRFPRVIGIISSRDAAGYGDFLRIARSRLPGVTLRLVHVAVQGRDAEREIAAAFDRLNEQPDLDVIVLVRGGGSLEDLHAFNAEPVARAVVRSRVPVVVGVGHERDVTIADFCADVRAATPSNAAQLVLPTREEAEALVRRLAVSGQRQVERRIAARREAVGRALHRIPEVLRAEIRRRREYVAQLVKTVEALSPQAVLERGYSLTYQEDGRLLRSPADTAPGRRLRTLTAAGEVRSMVEE